MPKKFPHFPEYHKHFMTIVIEDVIYIVTFIWRERMGSWYFSLSLQDETEIVRGRRLTPGWNPLYGLLLPDAPPGSLWVQAPDDFEQEDLGGKFKLYYMTEAEMAVEVADEDGPTYEVIA